MLYCFKKGKNATEMQKKSCAVYGEGAVTDQMHQKWFAKFCAGDSLLDSAPWLGRPVEGDSDQTEMLIENNQHYIPWEIVNMFKISKSIKLVVKKKMCLLNYGKNPYGLFGQPNIIFT